MMGYLFVAVFALSFAPANAGRLVNLREHDFAKHTSEEHIAQGWHVDEETEATDAIRVWPMSETELHEHQEKSRRGWGDAETEFRKHYTELLEGAKAKLAQEQAERSYAISSFAERSAVDDSSTATSRSATLKEEEDAFAEVDKLTDDDYSKDRLQKLKDGFKPVAKFYMCSQLDLGLHALVPGLSLNLGIAGGIQYDTNHRCFGWHAELMLGFSYGFKAFGYGLGVGISVEGSVDLMEAPINFATEGGWVGAAYLPDGVDGDHCRSADPWPVILAYIKKAQLRATTSEGVAAAVAAELNKIPFDPSVTGYDIYQTVLQPEAMFKESQESTGKLTFVAPLLVDPTSALLAAEDFFSMQLANYAAQAKSRLVTNKDKLGTDGAWFFSGKAKARQTQNTGRFLARWPGKETLESHDLQGVVGVNHVEDGRVMNFGKIMELSEERHDPLFWREVAMSAGHYFVRMVSDVQALWNVYMADDAHWDGECLSLPASFQSPSETKSKITGRTTTTAATRGDKFEAKMNPFHKWHWASSEIGASKAAAFVKGGGQSMDEALARRSGKMLPVLWCNLATTHDEEFDIQAGHPVQENDALVASLDGLRLRVDAACSVLGASGDEVETRFECEQAVLSAAFVRIHPSFSLHVAHLLRTIERSLLEIHSCTNKRLRNVDGSRIRELLAPMRATRNKKFEYSGPLCSGRVLQSSDKQQQCKEGTSLIALQAWAEPECEANPTCEGYTVLPLMKGLHLVCLRVQMAALDEARQTMGNEHAEAACFLKKEVSNRNLAAAWNGVGSLEEFKIAQRQALIDDALLGSATIACATPEGQLEHVAGLTESIVGALREFTDSIGADGMKKADVLGSMQLDFSRQFGQLPDGRLVGEMWQQLEDASANIQDNIGSYKQSMVQRLQTEREAQALGSVPGLALPPVHWTDTVQFSVHAAHNGFCTPNGAALILKTRTQRTQTSWSSFTAAERCWIGRFRPADMFIQVHKCSGKDGNGEDYSDWRVRFQSVVVKADLLNGEFSGLLSAASLAATASGAGMTAAAVGGGALSAVVMNKFGEQIGQNPALASLTALIMSPVPFGMVALGAGAIGGFGQFCEILKVASKSLAAHGLINSALPQAPFGVGLSVALVAWGTSTYRERSVTLSQPSGNAFLDTLPITKMVRFKAFTTLHIEMWNRARLHFEFPAVGRLEIFASLELDWDVTPWAESVWNRKLYKESLARRALCAQCVRAGRGFCDTKHVLGSYWSAERDACRAPGAGDSCQAISSRDDFGATVSADWYSGQEDSCISISFRPSNSWFRKSEVDRRWLSEQ